MPHGRELLWQADESPEETDLGSGVCLGGSRRDRGRRKSPSAPRGGGSWRRLVPLPEWLACGAPPCGRSSAGRRTGRNERLVAIGTGLEKRPTPMRSIWMRNERRVAIARARRAAPAAGPAQSPTARRRARRALAGGRKKTLLRLQGMDHQNQSRPGY